MSLHKRHVDAEWLDEPLPCYLPPMAEVTWNGWACPVMDREQVERLMTSKGTGLSFRWIDSPEVEALLVEDTQGGQDVIEAQYWDSLGDYVWPIAVGLTWRYKEQGWPEHTGPSVDYQLSAIRR